MLVIKKELDFQDFMTEFKDVLDGLDWEACEMIFDLLCDIMNDGMDEITARDYIRFQVQVQTQNEVIDNYDIIDEDDMEGMDEGEIHEAVENYLNDNTCLLGYYKDGDGVIVYVFDEF